jgi:topoisomerase IV subunit A
MSEILSLRDAIGERYLAYAVSTIKDRSLPDVRDGLKPVHRRVLYGIYTLNIKQGYKKSARIVGDVMGRFHPHGDSAIYESMVRLAQDFSLRYPMVDGQGNFGTIDGDNPAAMRYTEARLSDVAFDMLNGIESAEFKSTYDGEEREPSILPAAFPNLLANGSQGIAVGIATNIPPHNVYEITNLLDGILQENIKTISQVLAVFKGPDFPTGGVIINSNLEELYTTGKGMVRIRSRYNIELPNKIIITEIPYQVTKTRILEEIGDLAEQKKLPIDNLRDESDSEIRIVIECKNPESLVKSLFQSTSLESKITFSMYALDKDKTPKCMNIFDICNSYIEHRLNFLQRQRNFRLENIVSRLEIVEAYVWAASRIKDVIEAISNDNSEFFKDLSERQYNSLLDMKLRSLKNIEKNNIEKELSALILEKRNIESLNESKQKQKNELTNELKSLRKKYSLETRLGARRTTFENVDLDEEVTITREKEDVTVIISEDEFIKTVKGHTGVGIHCDKYDKIIFATSLGRFFSINVEKLSSGRGNGDPVRLMMDLESNENILNYFLHDIKERYVLVSEEGFGFIVSGKSLSAQTKQGKKIMNSGSMALCLNIKEEKHLALVGENRKMAIISIDEIPEQDKGKGVRLQKTSKIVSGSLIMDKLRWISSGNIKEEKNFTRWIVKRGQTGRIVPVGFSREYPFFP